MRLGNRLPLVFIGVRVGVRVQFRRKPAVGFFYFVSAGCVLDLQRVVVRFLVRHNALRVKPVAYGDVML
jgi:hypothetical protein